MRLGDRGAAAALVVLIVVAYLPALGAGFVWDDDHHVTKNAALASTAGLAAVWTTLDATPQYYPLTHTVFWIEHALWGLDPRGFHAVNLLLHAISALILWRTLRLLEVPGAWLVAAIFGVHPVHVESVAWVSELKNTLSGCLYLGASRIFLGWALDRERGPARPWIASAMYLLALLSKTVTSTWPIAMAIVLWWKTARVDRRAIAWLAPLLAVGAAFGAVTHRLEATQIGTSGADWSLPFVSRVALSARIVWFYLGKLVWPDPLSFIYPRWTVDATSPAAWVWMLSALAVAAVLFTYRDRLGRGPSATLAFFVVTLAPALSFFDVYPMRYSWVADHFQYLASIGPIALACAAWARRTISPRRRVAGVAITAAVLLAASGRTFGRCGAYRDEETLWRDTLRHNPHAWIAHNNLGVLLAERGAHEEAASEFARVLALRPSHSGARANLGYLQELMGRPEAAVLTLREAAAARPEDADVRIHLVRILIATGRLDDAVSPAVEAARLRPGDPDVLCDAGSLLARAGRTAEAIPLLERAIALRPGFPRAAANLERARRAAADLRYPPTP